MTTDTSLIFDKEYIQFSDNYLTNDRTNQEVRSIISKFGGARIQKILDLGCGAGRISLKLAEQGYMVTGLDWNGTAINIARKNDKTSLVNFIRKDYNTLDYITEFDCVISWYTSFGYFSEKENNELLAKTFSSLKPEGLLILDHLNRDKTIRAFQKHIVEEYNNNIMIDERRFDPLDGFLYQNRTFIVNNEIKKIQYKIRLYTPTEITTLLTHTGFRCVSIKDEDNNSFSSESKRMIILARK